MRLLALFTILLFVLLSSCAEYANVQSSEIESLEIESDPSSPSNHGSIINIEVIAVLKKGARKNITKHPNLKIESDFISELEKGQILISARPDRFGASHYPLQLLFTDSISTINSFDSLELNHQGDIHVLKSAQDGKDGKPQRKSGVTLFNPNGVEGRPGNDGADGENGPHFTAYIWKVKSTTFMRIENDSTGIVWKYKSVSCDSIIIDLSGGNGGHGSAGGEGGNGKDGKDGSRGVRLPGKGGDGGTGGNGGNAGTGGSILIFVHSSAKHLVEKIETIQKNGKRGFGGAAGLPGKPGKAIEGYPPESPGQTGTRGKDGNLGGISAATIISIIDFDYNQLD